MKKIPITITCMVEPKTGESAVALRREVKLLLTDMEMTKIKITFGTPWPLIKRK